jgi:hypothetical protein
MSKVLCLKWIASNLSNHKYPQVALTFVFCSPLNPIAEIEACPVLQFRYYVFLAASSST